MSNLRIVVTHYGGPDALQVVEEERPEPKSGEVRVRMLAAGVSLHDVMAREGIHPETPLPPYTPGWDLVGVVDRLGDGVTGIEPGQTVAAMPIHGAYAEYVCLRDSVQAVAMTRTTRGQSLPSTSTRCTLPGACSFRAGSGFEFEWTPRRMGWGGKGAVLQM